MNSEQLEAILPKKYLRLADNECTWGDTKHKSNAVRHGYNEALSDCIEALLKAEIIHKSEAHLWCEVCKGCDGIYRKSCAICDGLGLVRKDKQ